MYRAQHAFDNLRIDWSNVDIEHQFLPATADSEAMVQVAIEYPFRLLTPVITDIVGGDTFVLRAEASHVRIAN